MDSSWNWLKGWPTALGIRNTDTPVPPLIHMLTCYSSPTNRYLTAAFGMHLILPHSSLDSNLSRWPSPLTCTLPAVNYDYLFDNNDIFFGTVRNVVRTYDRTGWWARCNNKLMQRETPIGRSD